MKSIKKEGKEETEVQADNATVLPLKMAFFITPLGSNGSDIRRHADGIIKAVIRPALQKHDIHLIPPHEIDNPGNITKQIVSHILSADLVLADLTGLNANVMYEVAVRHAKRKPIIVIAEEGTKLPFDLAAERTFFYTNDMAGVVQLLADLDRIIPVALQDETPDNPIYSGVEAMIINDVISREADSTQAFILQKLEQVDELTSLVKTFISNQREGNNRPPSKTPWYRNPKLYPVVDGLTDQKFPINGTVIYKDSVKTIRIGHSVFHPDWGKGQIAGFGQAKSDGQLIIIVRANGIYQSVPVFELKFEDDVFIQTDSPNRTGEDL